MIATGSGGNCYQAKDSGSSLLIECGVGYKSIQRALNFNVSSVRGCLITHEHKDHCKSIVEVLRAGVNCYMSQGTADEIGIKHHRIKIIEARKQFKVGDWTILPFETQHDAKEPLGFLIMSKAGEKLLFATDTYYIRYKFKGLNIIAVECNYSEEILEQNILSGRVPVVFRNRLKRSHMSLENFKEFIRENDTRQVREVWLLHMSNTNGHEEMFKREIQKIVGMPVYIAQEGY